MRTDFACCIVLTLLAACSHEPRPHTAAIGAPAPHAAPPSVVTPPPDAGLASADDVPNCLWLLQGECGLHRTPSSDEPGLDAIALATRPWTATSPGPPPDPMSFRHRVAGISVDATHLWVTIERCPMCARIIVSHSRADLTQATDAELSRLQRWLGLPGSPALRSKLAWQHAFGK